MCGIVAVAALSPPSMLLRDRLHQATTALNHRGPDGSSIWLSESGVRPTVGLGHSRLAVNGGPLASQPIANEDTTVFAVVNGEIYDPGDSLRNRLIGQGHEFRTHGDSELIVHLYEQHGLEFVSFLRGEFAILIYDTRQGRLIAVRDRFGIKPLVYSPQDGKIWFASQARALAAAGIPINSDEESVWHSCSFQYTLPNRTLFENVFQLQPGHLACWNSSGLTLRKYWDCDYPEAASFQREEHGIHFVEEFRQLFSESVQIRLRGDVPVTAHLSGGIDSCSVLSVASDEIQQAFTVAFSDDSYDERAIAGAVASTCDVELQQVCGDPESLIKALPEAIEFTEGWAINGHLPAKYLLNRAIRAAGYKVALTGEGADELLFGYPHLRVDYCHALGLESSQIWRENEASRGIMLATEQQLNTSYVQRRLGYVPAFISAKASLGMLLRSHLDVDFLAQFQHRNAYEELLDAIAPREQLQGRHPVHQSTYLWNKTALAQYILRTLGDGCETAHGVEGRLPMLDHALFDSLKHLPHNAFFGKSSQNVIIEKQLLRCAMRKRLPRCVIDRPKHPFVAPPLCESFGKTSIRDALEAAIDSQRYFDPIKLRATLTRVSQSSRAERIATDPLWWVVLSAAATERSSMRQPKESLYV